MRTPSLGSVAYQPGQVPSDPKGLAAYLNTELNSIAAAIQLLAAGHLDTSHVAPTKPRAGDIRLCDGVHWNAGAGAGVYAYYDAGAGLAWNKLG